MWQVIHAADILGVSLLEGWYEEERGRYEKYDPRRGAALRAGFKVLCGGPEAVKAHFSRIAFSGPYRSERERTGIFRVFGGLRAIILRMPDFWLANQLRTWLIEAANDLGIVSRKDRPAVRSLGGAAYTLNEVAEVLRMKTMRARELALIAGVIKPLANKNDRHWISPEELARMQDVLNGLVARSEAERMAGLKPTEFRQRCGERGIKPVMRLWGPGPSSDRFSKFDLLGLIHPDGAAPPRGGPRIHMATES